MKTRRIIFTIFVFVVVYFSINIIFQSVNLTTRKLYNIVHLPRHYLSANGNDTVERSSTSKLLCMIFTYPKNINKTLAVLNTWARRCDKHLLFSNITLPHLPTVILNVTESRHFLAKKTKLAFEYVYKHYLTEFDWFLKADDDVYILIENLKSYINQFDPSEKVYLGRKFSKFKGRTFYMSGGAGYVLSRNAVQIMVEKCFPTMELYFRTSIEDMAVGSCAERQNFTAPDSRDSLGKERFHSFNPADYVNDKLPKWIAWYSINEIRKGLECCSNETISFHYMLPSEMYLLEFYLYELSIRNRIKR